MEPAEFGLAFPVVVKPLTRLASWDDTFGLRKALAAQNPDALRRLWPQLTAMNADLLAQEPVPGAEARIESYHC